MDQPPTEARLSQEEVDPNAAESFPALEQDSFELPPLEEANGKIEQQPEHHEQNQEHHEQNQEHHEQQPEHHEQNQEHHEQNQEHHEQNQENHEEPFLEGEKKAQHQEDNLGTSQNESTEDHNTEELPIDHEKIAIQKFESLFNSPQYSDISFGAGDLSFRCHKVVLATWSQELRDLIADHQEIVLGDVDPQILGKVLRYLYTGKITFAANIVVPVQMIAHKFGIESLLNSSSKFLASSVNVQSCCVLLEHAQRYGVKPLEDKCKEEITNQFSDIVKEEGFLQLSVQNLLWALESDLLNAEEMEVFTAAMKWIQHDTSRSSFLDQILNLIRFPCIPMQSLAILDSDPVASTSALLPKLLLEAFKFHANPSSANTSNAKYKKRAPSFARRWIFDYKGRIEKFIIPQTGIYKIKASGAKAADGNHKKGGRGAILEALFLLKKDDALYILAGGMSVNDDKGTGGGGGSFVSLKNMNTPLIVAGGGGGTRGYIKDEDGADASLDTFGTNGKGRFAGAGGKQGNSGQNANPSSYGGGGAGYLTGRGMAMAFVKSGSPGLGGGFGCGGSRGSSGGGGGGGYSGGGGGQGGGGGGSFVSSSATGVKKSVGNMSHGRVIIKWERSVEKEPKR